MNNNEWEFSYTFKDNADVIILAYPREGHELRALIAIKKKHIPEAQLLSTRGLTEGNKDFYKRVYGIEILSANKLPTRT